MSKAANDQKANHCKKPTMDFGKYWVTREGNGRVTTMIGRNMALRVCKPQRKVGYKVKTYLKSVNRMIMMIASSRMV